MSVPNAHLAARSLPASSSAALPAVGALVRLIGTFDAPRFRVARACGARSGLGGYWPPMFPQQPPLRLGQQRLSTFLSGSFRPS